MPDPNTVQWNVNTDLVQSNDYMLFVGDLATGSDQQTYTVLGYGKSNGISISQDTAEASSKFSCAWKASSATRLGYQITADALYCTNDDAASFDTLLAMMVSQENIAWALGKAAEHSGTCDTNPFTLDTTQDYYSGQGLITSLDMNADQDDVVSCSITIEGTNEILKNGSPIGG